MVVLGWGLGCGLLPGTYLRQLPTGGAAWLLLMQAPCLPLPQATPRRVQCASVAPGRRWGGRGSVRYLSLQASPSQLPLATAPCSWPMGATGAVLAGRSRAQRETPTPRAALAASGSGVGLGAGRGPVLVTALLRHQLIMVARMVTTALTLPPTEQKPTLRFVGPQAAGNGKINPAVASLSGAIAGGHYRSDSILFLLPLQSVCELKSPSVSDFLWGLENSGWLKHIKAIIDAGIFIAKAVAEEGVSVLVHCSDGWDRTAQVCSVASLLLDPFYRTIKGFMVLIEKDWVSFGHKFNHRYGYLNGDPKEISPVIDQFIECIWQLMEQFPCAFEFNERFLIHIQHHIYSCQFGNFLCNSQKERQELKIQERTYSLWAHLWKNRANYMNPLYREDHNQTQGTLHPQTASCNFLYKFWSGMYTRFEKGMHPGQSVTDYLMAVKEETQQLEEELEVLEQRLANLKKVQLNNRKENYKQQDHNTHLGLSTSNNSIANTPQDYINNVKSFPSRSPSQGDEEDSALILTQDNLKSSDPDLSANSDQESGVEDLGCRSPSGGCCLPTEDSGKDSDEAVFHAV
uniref:Myotubularin related protein 7 n=1 Tax=Chelonoidis abingdonii TaxID=106734 RepID=A0A8C0HA13_CHEAB